MPPALEAQARDHGPLDERAREDVGLAAARQPLQDLPSAFWWLWASTFVARVANFVVPFSTLYLTMDRGISDSAAGSLVALYGLGTVGGSSFRSWMMWLSVSSPQ